MIIDGIDISRKYSIAEIIKLYHKGRLREVAVAGYIVRADADGMVGFVPASESTLFRMERGKTLVHQSEDYAQYLRDEVEREHPMVRRSAQEKKAAMVRRLLSSARVYGTVPGLTDEQISAMIGEPWKTGVSVVTSEMLDRVSEYFLGRAEVDNREADRHRVTREHALA